MKKIIKTFIELYNNELSKYGLAIGAVGIIAIVGAAVALTGGIIAKAEGDKNARVANNKADRAARKLEALENSRQEILNQGEKIREMKSQVFNPYANVAVAMKGTELKIAQTDEALANTLDVINQSGTGAGGATALAKMAAQSKAQIGASIETQEAQNQQLRMKGEADMITQKMELEQSALTAEEAGWGRQETREMQALNRTAAQQQNAEQQAMAWKMAGNEALMQGMSGATEGAGTAASAFSASDRRLKDNIKLVGHSPSGLKIYKFKYKDTKYGKGFFEGVMSDEIPNSAVENINGYDMVNYDLIDVEFKNL